jgi:AcrR family transcriptional regulator
MRPPKTQGGEATRQTLIEASFRLFTTKGYNAASMRDIAAEAGITAGSIYNHFADKEQIFTAVILAYHPIVRVLPVLSEVEGQSAEQLIRDAAHRMVAEMEKNPGIFSLVAIEIVELNGKHLEQLITEMLPHVRGFLARVYASGSKLRPANPLTFFRSFIGMLLGYGVTHFALRRTASLQMPEASLDDLIEFFLHGVIED